MTSVSDVFPTADPALSLLDEPALARLFDLAGPAQGLAIIDRLILDLTFVRQSLTTALAAGDKPALRRQLHVLIGVSGTVGAGPMHDAAVAIADEVRTGRLSRVAQLDHSLQVLITRLAVIRCQLTPR